MAKHIDVGLYGENAVAAYLVDLGWDIVEMRWRDHMPGGLRTDIDLIACSSDGLWHFIEVKTRSGSKSIGGRSPEAAVTPAKIRRMLQAAERYLDLHGLTAEISIDLATVIHMPPLPPHIRYYADIAR